MDGQRLAMFPLGTVLLPSMILPLHVFEDRYRTMLADVLASERQEFGVVLIERGSEVGGGDTRTDVGCVARVVEAERTPDGRWLLECIGERRIAVTTWLADEPYPAALVRDDPDEPASSDMTASFDMAASFDRVLAKLRRVHALASELGAPGLPVSLELSEDPILASYQIGVLSPLGALDRQRVLAAPGPAQRLSLLESLLQEQEELLRARLAFGGD